MLIFLFYIVFFLLIAFLYSFFSSLLVVVDIYFFFFLGSLSFFLLLLFIFLLFSLLSFFKSQKFKELSKKQNSTPLIFIHTDTFSFILFFFLRCAFIYWRFIILRDLKVLFYFRESFKDYFYDYRDQQRSFAYQNDAGTVYSAKNGISFFNFLYFFAFLKAFFGAFWCTNRFCVFFFFFFVFFLKGTVAFCTGIHLYFLC